MPNWNRWKQYNGKDFCSGTAIMMHLKTLQDQGKIQLPLIPGYATNNAHMFYLVCRNAEERTKLIARLRENNILAIFHYLSLHKSPFYTGKHDGRVLPNADRLQIVYCGCLCTMIWNLNLFRNGFVGYLTILHGKLKIYFWATTRQLLPKGIRDSFSLFQFPTSIFCLAI